MAKMSMTVPQTLPGEKLSNNMMRWTAQTAVQSYRALQKPTELAAFLAVLVDLNPKPKIMVEIGCDAGGTLWAWKQIGIPRVIGIEYPQESKDADGNPWGTTNLLVPHGCETIRGDSHKEETRTELAGLLGGQPIDVLFIDADHTYEGVKRDYVMYAPLVANEGLIAMHDISPHPNHPGVEVQKFWQQIGGDKDEILLEPDYWGGIGFVRQWREDKPMMVGR